MAQLAPPQRFSVVFFQDNEAVPMPNFAALPLATADHKRAALRWMHQEVVPRGRSNPLRALEMALAIQPDVIFLLSENITGAGPFEIEADRLLAAGRSKSGSARWDTRHSHQVRSIFGRGCFGCVETNRRGPWWTRRLQLCGARRRGSPAFPTRWNGERTE